MTATDETTNAGFGKSVALSADGATALIGGYGDNGLTGAAWLFDRSGSAWTQRGSKLTAGDEAGAAGFGRSTAISADASTVLVGGALDNGYAGAAWAFTPATVPTPTPATDSAGGGGGGGGSIPDLAVTVGGPAEIATGGQATFSLAVSDVNGAGATGVHTIVTLPAGATVNSTYSDRGSGCAAVTAAGTLDCNLDFLSGALVAHVTIALTLPTAGAAALSATVTDNQGDKSPANNTASATVQVGSTTTSTANPPADDISGTAKADHLSGTGGADVIKAGRGNDWVNGGAGNDTIYGGTGNDILYGGPGADLIYGGTGNDTIHAADGVKDTIDCGLGHDVVYADRHDKVAKNCENVHRMGA